MPRRFAGANSTALLEVYIPGLRRFARALLRGDCDGADDLVQDTLERALSGWHLRRVQDDLRGWLYTILYNRFLSDRSHRKRWQMHHTPMADVIEEELPGVEGGQHWAIEYRDFLSAFATLPREQRAVMLLIAVEDLSYEKAARVLGVPIGTVMSRLSRGRERLRRLGRSNTGANFRHRTRSESDMKGLQLSTRTESDATAAGFWGRSIRRLSFDKNSG